MLENHFETHQIFKGKLSPFGSAVFFIVDSNETLVTLKDKHNEQILSQTRFSHLKFDLKANEAKLVVRFPKEDKLFGDGRKHKVVFEGADATNIHKSLGGGEKK